MFRGIVKIAEGQNGICLDFDPVLDPAEVPREIGARIIHASVEPDGLSGVEIHGTVRESKGLPSLGSFAMQVGRAYVFEI